MQPLCSLFVQHGCLLFLNFFLFSPTIYLSCFSCPGWLIDHGGISIHIRVDSVNFLRKCLPTCRNLAIMLTLNSCTSKPSLVKVNLMNNKQPYSTKKLNSGHHLLKTRGAIPTSLTPYKECMIDRRKMPNALRGLIQGLRINEIE